MSVLKLSVAASVVVLSELLYRCYRNIYNTATIRSTAKEQNNNNSSEKHFTRVVFFPDEGILDALAPDGTSSRATLPEDKYRFSADDVVSDRATSRRSSCSNDTVSRGKASSCQDIYKSGMAVPQYLSSSTSLWHLLTALDGARHSIDVCVLLLTCTHLTARLICAKSRGVRVRVLLDRSMSSVAGSSVATLRRNDIAVRLHSRSPNIEQQHQRLEHDGSAPEPWLLPGSGVPERVNVTAMMHHKFAVVDGVGRGDESSLVMTGSFNWTWSGVVSNNENVIISNSPQLVIPFIAQFEELWRQAQ